MIEQFGHGGDVETASASFGWRVDSFLDYSANINPLGPPPQVMEVIRDGLSSVIRYPDPAHRALRQKLSGYLGVPAEMLCIGNGAAECMALLILGLKPEMIGTVEPCFSEYSELARKFGSEVASVFGSEDRHWRAPLEDILSLLGQVDMLFLGQPNNPNGVQYGMDELSALAAKAEEEQTYLILDEAFIDFIEPNCRITLLPEIQRYPHVVLVRSMTKFYAIPGLRLGYAAAHPDVIQAMRNKQVSWSVNGLALSAGLACLDSGEAYEMDTISMTVRERARLADGLTMLGCRATPSEVNYLLIKLPAPWTAQTMQRELGEQGILIRSCAMYPGLEAGHIRVAVKDGESNQRLLAAMDKALNKRMNEGSSDE
ncbi:threonine-phosphate decarboxylase CobD [Paenibacillus sp. JX-17]|uniref:threonine-phosphate decarboxylase n=1 Tax=Paenibacillus lacisoli TaxID=3064525 RepID=A0ABT9CDJ8_9BACL|nr:threonine-phosphate decarboxylase CobD [Paenibacillus sp. JX-17]MDO7907326.1 threonine-phosphate decarboxylase CobD [Paenibacillus sp. JX-17]